MDVLFFFQAEDGIRDLTVTGVQTCALPISHRSDDFLLRGLWPRHATLPPSFRNSSQLAGISRVCTGSSNNPDTFRYTHFPPLMRRTSSSRSSFCRACCALSWSVRASERTGGIAV